MEIINIYKKIKELFKDIDSAGYFGYYKMAYGKKYCICGFPEHFEIYADRAYYIYKNSIYILEMDKFRKINENEINIDINELNNLKFENNEFLKCNVIDGRDIKSKIDRYLRMDIFKNLRKHPVEDYFVANYETLTLVIYPEHYRLLSVNTTSIVYNDRSYLYYYDLECKFPL